jgi:hypothetical protein
MATNPMIAITPFKKILVFTAVPSLSEVTQDRVKEVMRLATSPTMGVPDRFSVSNEPEGKANCIQDCRKG